jgi:hypothetical protein
MCDLDIVTHAVVERTKPGGYYYLHEATIAWYRDRFYLGWANHRTREDDNRNELIRGTTSPDALHWKAEPSIWIQAPAIGGESFNHPLLFTQGDTLYGFFVAWYNRRPTTELFILDDATGIWEHQKKSSIPNFVPFCTPQRMDDGNWITGGSTCWDEAAVIISKGDDLTQWEKVIITRPDTFKLIFPETAIINQGNRLLALCRPNQNPGYRTSTAPVSESRDYGRTWTPLALSNFPLAPSQPFAGRLSTGQNYLLTCNLEEGRHLITIAVTGPDGGLFHRIFKLRHQEWPVVRHFGGWGDGSRAGMTTEWAYPGAIERNGNLYVTYSQGKEDCVLSIVPLDVLTV